MKKSFTRPILVIVLLMIFIIINPFVFADENSSNISIPIPPISGNPPVASQDAQKLQTAQPPIPVQPESPTPPVNQQDQTEITPPIELPPDLNQQQPVDPEQPPIQPVSTIPTPWFLSFWFIAIIIIIIVIVILIFFALNEGKFPEKTVNKTKKDMKVKTNKKNKK